MSALMNEFERVQRRRKRFPLLVSLACVTGIGVWLTGPLGVLVVSGNSIGWLLIAAGVLLLAAMVIADRPGLRLVQLR